MAITEIALLRLSEGKTIENATLRTKLANAKKVMQDYTGRTFYYFQQFEDSSYIYIIGEWDSLDQHMNHFIPSQENQALLESLKDELSVEWLQHIDVSHSDLPLPKTEGDKAKAHSGELVISLVRHFIKSGAREEFQKTFEANKHYLQDYLTEGTMGGGWRIDREGDQEEWVLMCPFKSVQQHDDFAKTDAFSQYGRIREHINGADVKHARLVEI